MNYLTKIGAITACMLLLGACGSSNDDDDDTVTDAEFEVRLTNLTNGQTLSPVAVMMHKSGFNSFVDGEASSLALELLAEGGDNTDVLGEVQAATQHVASASTAGAVGPGVISPAVTLTVPNDDLGDLQLSVISMLVVTNDAFTGLNATDISNMQTGESRTFNGPTWDSGTEANSETAATIPALAGEGFNPVRNDLFDRVRFHQGVVTNASPEFGLATSALTETHRFLNPSSRIVVTRTQ